MSYLKFRIKLYPLELISNKNRLLLFIVAYMVPLCTLAADSTGLTADMGKTLVNLSRTFPSFMNFISIMTVTIGVFFIFLAMFKLKHLADFRNMMSGQQEVGKAIFMLLLGGVFIWMPYVLEAFTYSVYRMDMSSMKSAYPIPGARGGFNFAFFQMMQVIGLMSFIRGWFMLVGMSKGQQQPGTLGKALTHIFSGVMLFHLYATMTILDKTLGTSMSSVFN